MRRAKIELLLIVHPDEEGISLKVPDLVENDAEVLEEYLYAGATSITISHYEGKSGRELVAHFIKRKIVEKQEALGKLQAVTAALESALDNPGPVKISAYNFDVWECQSCNAIGSSDEMPDEHRENCTWLVNKAVLEAAQDKEKE